MTTRRRRKRRRRLDPRFAAVCLLFALAGGGVWLWQRDRGPAGEGVEVPDAETIELPEDAAQESTPDTDPADERRDDTNG